MTSDDIVTMFRNEMGDYTAPYLWTDQEVYPFVDDAQQMFCRLTDGISDARTAAVCNLSVIPNTDWYTTHSSILNIRKITRADTGKKVDMLTAEQADSRGVIFLATLLGTIRYVVLGLEPHAVRMNPMPNETVTLNMQVFRLPLVAITDVGGQAMEIDAQHHTSLVMWMKSRAYDKQDTETFDRRKSDDYKTRFEKYCEKVHLEQERARRVQGNVAYGGVPIANSIGPDNRYARF